MKRIFVGGTHAKGYDISNCKEPPKYITFLLWDREDCVGSTAYRLRAAFSDKKVAVYAENSITDRQVLALLCTAYME